MDAGVVEVETCHHAGGARGGTTVKQLLLREAVGEALRENRLAQGRTLRQVSSDARVSLGYLSEVERGQKEASSELLVAICDALGLPLSALLLVVSGKLDRSATPASAITALAA